MRSNQFFLAASLSLAATFLSLPAQADDATDARVFYQKGNKAFREGDDVMAREYYRKSLELEDSFDTMCNLGRAEARSELWETAYEHLRLCVELYPDDPDLADSKAQFAQLRDEVRKELTFEEAKPIEERVEAELERREQAAAAVVAPPPEEEEAPEVESGLEEAEGEKKSSARLPVSLAIGGVGIVGVGVGIVFHAIAGGTKKDADAIQQEITDGGVSCGADAAPARCGDLDDKIDTRDTQANIGTVGLIAGGVLVAGAVVTYLVWPDKSSGVGSVKRPRVLPTLEVGRGGEWQFGLSGQF